MGSGHSWVSPWEWWSQEWEDHACLGDTTRLKWCGDELRKDKRNKHKARRSTKEIYEWKEKRIHRIRLDGDSHGGEQKCEEEDERNMYLSILELYDAHKEPHAMMYSAASSVHIFTWGCLILKRAFSEQTRPHLLPGQDQLAGQHLLGLRRQLRTRQDAFVKWPEDKYRNRLITLSTNTRSAPFVRLLCVWERQRTAVAS